MTNEGEVYFTIWGDADPREITSILGIEPTSSCTKGVPRSDGPTPHQSEWIYSTGIVRADFINIYSMVSELVARLRPLEDRIVRAMSTYEVSAHVQVNIDFAPHKVIDHENVDGAEIGFEPDIVQFLSNVGAGIAVDIYYD